MPNYNPLIFTSADWTPWLQIAGGGNYKLRTVESIDCNIVAEEEIIYAVGEEDGVGNKQNSRKISGKISIQTGEIMAICAAEGLTDAARIQGATISLVAIRGGLGRTIKNVNINTDNFAVKRKDKETLSSLDFTGLTSIPI